MSKILDSGRYWTYRDLKSGKLPNGNIDPNVVNMIAENNPSMMDVVWHECAKGKDDVVTIKTGMPKATVRRFYEGVVGSKSSKKQVTNSCATVSSAIEFDKRLLDAEKNKAAYLAEMQQDHTSVISAGVARLLFHGSTKDSADVINGFDQTFSAYGGDSFTADDKSAFYCLNGGHATVQQSGSKLRSIYMVGWGRKGAYGIYPEGSNVGINIGEMKEQYVTVKNADGVDARLLMCIQEFNQDCGLSIADFRTCGRIANIDIARALGTTGVPDYVKLLKRIMTRVKTEGVSTHLYMCKMVFDAIAEQCSNKTAENAIKYPDLFQKLPGSIMGVPVSFNDALNVDEAPVPAFSES